MTSLRSLRSLPSRVLLVPAVALLSFGCISARLVAPHQPYAALLDHEGQLDIAVRAGVMDETDTTVGAHVAVSPVDGFEIAASVDGDWSTDDNATEHVGGGIALGGYSRTDVFRAEVLVGANAGTAAGDATNCRDLAACSTLTTFALDGPYVQPFVQGLVGFEVPYFELAGGMRLFGYLADVSMVGSDGSTSRTGYERVYLEQIVTIRVPVDIVRFEVLATLPVMIAGDSGPMPNSSESGLQPSITFGIALQLDTMGEPVE